MKPDDFATAGFKERTALLYGKTSANSELVAWYLNFNLSESDTCYLLYDLKMKQKLKKKWKSVFVFIWPTFDRHVLVKPVCPFVGYVAL